MGQKLQESPLYSCNSIYALRFGREQAVFLHPPFPDRAGIITRYPPTLLASIFRVGGVMSVHTR